MMSTALWTEPRLFDVDGPQPEQLDVFDALGSMTVGTDWLQLDGTVFDVSEIKTIETAESFRPNRKKNNMSNHPVRARHVATATWDPDERGRAYGGTAAAVRRHLKAEQVLADTRSKLTEFDESWVIENTADGDVVRCVRTITIMPPRVSTPIDNDPDVWLEPVTKTLVYVFIRIRNRWYGTGRTAPNMATDEQLVDWCIDHEIRLESFERATFPSDLADVAAGDVYDDIEPEHVDAELLDDDRAPF